MKQVLRDRVLKAILDRKLIHPGDRVLIAVSGGTDSVALFYLLNELALLGEFSLAGIAHFNHQLRGSAADSDERFCRDLAARLGQPITVGTEDVRTLALDNHLSIEAAARTARYRFLEKAARDMAAQVIAVGHTRDDQAETFLLKLLRGAGPRGLGGIYPRRGIVIRPLLEMSRADLENFLEVNQIPSCEDETNRDLTNPRNRLRHEVLPFLNRFWPRVTTVLAREAEIARDDADWLERQASEEAERIITVTGDRIDLDAKSLMLQPPAIARRIAIQALRTVSRGRFIGFKHVESFLALARAKRVEHIGLDLPGQRVQRIGDTLTLVPEQAGRTMSPDLVPFRYELPIPGQVRLMESGCMISADPGFIGHPSIPSSLKGDVGSVAVIAAAQLTLPLLVRSRRVGDTFRPLGLAGHKKLQDLFVDRKVARKERDTVPIVVDAKDRIVWVVGSAIADDFKVTDKTLGVVTLKAEWLCGEEE